MALVTPRRLGLRLRVWTRNAHLASGLVLAGTLLAYALTGFVIVHGSFVPNDAERSREPAAFHFDAALLEAPGAWPALAERAAAELELRGRSKIENRLGPKGRLKIRFSRLAHNATLWLGPGSNTATIEREALGARKTLGNLHKLHGSRGGPGYRVAAFWVDFSGIAMILFAVSGVALWAWQKSDRLGAAILATSSLATLAAILSLTLGA